VYHACAETTGPLSEQEASQLLNTSSNTIHFERIWGGRAGDLLFIAPSIPWFDAMWLNSTCAEGLDKNAVTDDL
jgi:hypothetical protein